MDSSKDKLKTVIKQLIKEQSGRKSYIPPQLNEFLKDKMVNIQYYGNSTLMIALDSCRMMRYNSNFIKFYNTTSSISVHWKDVMIIQDGPQDGEYSLLLKNGYKIDIVIK